MKKFIITGLLFFAFVSFGQSQQKHKISQGETLFSISKKYNLKPEELVKLNPELKEGVKVGAIINLPSNVKGNYTSTETTNMKKFEYIVQPGETLYSIAKRLNVKVDELIKLNPTASEGVNAGQSLTYFATKKVEQSVASYNTNAVTRPNFHIVQAEETKYSVSKRFGMTIIELEELNPHIKDAFEIGMQIRLNKNYTLNSNENKTVLVSAKTMTYEVQQGETLYSISKKFGISPDEIIVNNPSVAQGLKVGSVLVLPAKKDVNPVKIEINTSKRDSIKGKNPKANLIESVDKTKQKNLVLFMPFNINKIEKDTSKTKLEYLKTDKFLNITLDFYAGALKAIDSAKSLGLPVKVRVYDTESSRYTSNVASIIKNNDFSSTDLIIGPFTNSFAETAAMLLEDKNIPVISPLSKEDGKGGKNIFYAMPNESIQKKKCLNT